MALLYHIQATAVEKEASEKSVCKFPVTGAEAYAGGFRYA